MIDTTANATVMMAAAMNQRFREIYRTNLILGQLFCYAGEAFGTRRLLSSSMGNSHVRSFDSWATTPAFRRSAPGALLFAKMF